MDTIYYDATTEEIVLVANGTDVTKRIPTVTLNPDDDAPNTSNKTAKKHPNCGAKCYIALAGVTEVATDLPCALGMEYRIALRQLGKSCKWLPIGRRNVIGMDGEEINWKLVSNIGSFSDTVKGDTAPALVQNFNVTIAFAHKINIESIPPTEDIEDLSMNRLPLSLFKIGFDWRADGFDVMVKLRAEILAQGVDHNLINIAVPGLELGKPRRKLKRFLEESCKEDDMPGCGAT